MSAPLTPREVRVSKFLAKHLRHRPDRIGVALGDGGWTDLQGLLEAAAAHGFPITEAELAAVLAEPTKRRYQLDPSGTQIRAVQGHSVAVELEYVPAAPPPVLWHGTHPQALDAILAEGLRPMRRRHVHLSSDPATARAVGARRGRPVVLEVDAAGAHAAGQVFLEAVNGVWLTGPLDPRWLRRA